MQRDAAGRVVLKLKAPRRDGTTHLVMSPLEFMQRLAALVPRPRLHLIRFGVRITSLREMSGPPLREHGVLAPNAKLRAQVIPAGPHDDAGAKSDPEVVDADEGRRWASRISWALLLKRVFEIDMQYCPNCGGELKVIAAIVDATVIERSLDHLGLPARPPPRSPARDPMPQVG